ncbi:MAG: hypothetical protein JWP10_669 [Nocardioidaceae bacterium]|nr:hypothetical protein [Nocardioidaceae bacterium]
MPTIREEFAVRLKRRWRRKALQKLPAFAGSATRKFDVVLHFADPEINLYQVRQWYGPLEHLALTHSVALVCYDPVCAEIVAGETSLPVVLIGHPRQMFARQQPKVILYPNQNYANFLTLGDNSCQHVFICHGESDKVYMSSNWVKVFNYYFIAGDAARARLSQRLFRYDLDTRTIAIGRPQIDVSYGSHDELVEDGRKVIFYAPTWEGGRPSMRYGSVASHGLAMVGQILADPRYRLIYRPHPRTGIQLPQHGEANDAIKDLIAAANADDPAAHHLVDASPFGWQLEAADLMITDVSAVAYDWLTTAKPLIVTRPADTTTVLDNEGFTADMPLLDVADVGRIGDLLDLMLRDRATADTMQAWSQFYYGDTSPGASMRRFVSAIERCIDERDAWIAETIAAGPVALEEIDPDVRRLGGAEDEDEGGRTLGSEFRTVRRFVRMMRRRRADERDGDDVVRRSRELAESSRTDFLVNFPAAPQSVHKLKRWIAVLEQLNEQAPTAIMVASVHSYRKVSKLTSLPTYLAFGMGQPEYIAQRLQTKVMLYVEQSRLNLREAGFHDIFHVFLGSPGYRRKGWLNNRLRLFDYVLAPDDLSAEWIRRRLLHPDAAATVEVVGMPAQRLDDADLPVEDLGVNAAAVSAALIRIRDQRDQAVFERKSGLLDLGIVLTKGGTG